MPPTAVQYNYSGTLTVPAGESGTLYSPGLFNQVLGPLVSGDTNSVLRIAGGVSFGGADSQQFDRFQGTIHVLPGATLRFALASSGNTFGSLIPTFRVDGSLRPRNAGNTIRLGAIEGTGALEGPQSNAGSGDTLYSIARRFGVTVQALQQRNNLANPNDIKVGQQLIIPAP
ncbi:MAG: LysM domain-containing protein [Thermoflexia bacterium]|nr:MAG: LysM domain-containing protein [Thermoflexia bacterium]